MIDNTKIFWLLLLGLFSAPKLGEAHATPKDSEKCKGIAKATENSCAAKKHGCAGAAQTEYDPDEWKFVKNGTCKVEQAKVKEIIAKAKKRKVK